MSHRLYRENQHARWKRSVNDHARRTCKTMATKNNLETGRLNFADSWLDGFKEREQQSLLQQYTITIFMLHVRLDSNY